MKINTEGSVTYKLTGKEQEKLVSEMETGLLESMQEIVNSSNFASVKEISYNKKFTEFDMKVDEVAYKNSIDSLASISLVMGSAYYQALSSKGNSGYAMQINYIDAETGETFDKAVFAEDGAV